MFKCLQRCKVYSFREVTCLSNQRKLASRVWPITWNLRLSVTNLRLREVGSAKVHVVMLWPTVAMVMAVDLGEVTMANSPIPPSFHPTPEYNVTISSLICSRCYPSTHFGFLVILPHFGRTN